MQVISDAPLPRFKLPVHTMQIFVLFLQAENGDRRRANSHSLAAFRHCGVLVQGRPNFSALQAAARELFEITAGSVTFIKYCGDSTAILHNCRFVTSNDQECAQPVHSSFAPILSHALIPRQHGQLLLAAAGVRSQHRDGAPAKGAANHLRRCCSRRAPGRAVRGGGQRRRQPCG